MIHKFQGLEAEVILKSAADRNLTITTMRARYPRIIHAELMTHRVFSRNARSSRAVPVKTMLAEIVNAPFVPWHWGKNQKGMQASQECNSLVLMEEEYIDINTVDCRVAAVERSREEAWLWARDQAVFAAEEFDNAGYHKQVANRLIEPFSYIETLITSVHWDNWNHLRDHEDAEPHIKDLAVLMADAYDEAPAKLLKHGEWHMPYITAEDFENARDVMDSDHAGDPRIIEHLLKVSVARCARISYKPFDGDGSWSSELRRYDDLVGKSPVHASPAEHQASPDRRRPVTIMESLEDGGTRLTDTHEWEAPELHGNLTGWKQYRKTLPNEAVMEPAI